MGFCRRAIKILKSIIQNPSLKILGTAFERLVLQELDNFIGERAKEKSLILEIELQAAASKREGGAVSTSMDVARQPPSSQLGMGSLGVEGAGFTGLGSFSRSHLTSPFDNDEDDEDDEDDYDVLRPLSSSLNSSGNSSASSSPLRASPPSFNFGNGLKQPFLGAGALWGGNAGTGSVNR